MDGSDDKGNLTVAELIHRSLDRLTPTERKIATALLSDYPFPGLETVAHLAKSMGVSSPTVLRLTSKLGFSSYAAFQLALRGELQARGNTPLSRGNADESANGADGDFLDRYRHSVLQRIDVSLQKVARPTFERTVTVLSDIKRPAYIIGGRLTESLAVLMFNHLRLMRPRVRLLFQANASEDLVDFDRRTVVVVFDIRRYQGSVIKVAEAAHRQGAVIILFTDAWLSPIAAFAAHVFALETEVVSSFDSFSPFSALIEAIIARISEQNWTAVKDRMNAIREMRITLSDDIP